MSGGISAKYGNRSMSGWARQNLTRTQARQRKKQEKDKEYSGPTEALRLATELVQRGVAPSAVEGFLLSQKESQILVFQYFIFYRDVSVDCMHLKVFEGYDNTI